MMFRTELVRSRRAVLTVRRLVWSDPMEGFGFATIINNILMMRPPHRSCWEPGCPAAGGSQLELNDETAEARKCRGEMGWGDRGLSK